MADPVSLAITIALNAATMALTAMKKIEGPRLSDLKVSTADYGTPLVQFYGTKRLECPCTYAEDIHEVKHQQKTKGGKYNEYKYYGTWASFIADHEIDNVLKLWLDKHLVMDKTGTGPDMVEQLQAGQIRYYYGTETQSPDPRLVAKIEAAEGPGTCPAYLGEAYMVFEEIPLELFGNRYPQVSCQATRAAAPLFPYVHLSPTAGFAGYYSSDGKMLVFNAGTAFELWDVANLTLISAQSGLPNLGSAHVAVNADGSFYASSGATSHTYLVDQAGGTTIVGGSIGGGLFLVSTGLYGRSALLFKEYIIPDILGNITVATSFWPSWFFNDADDITKSYSCGGVPSDLSNYTTGFYIREMGGVEVEHGFVVPTSGPCYALDNGQGQICLWQDDTLYLIDKTSWAIVSQVATVSGGTNGTWEATRPGDLSVWVNWTQYSTTNLTVLNTVNPGDYGLVATSADPLWDRINDAMWTKALLDTTYLVRYLLRSGGDGWTLGAICADVAVQCGMPASAFDFTNLDQMVLGYAWTQGPGKQIVGPLLDLFDSDIRPHGWIQQGLKRGQALSGDTLSTAYMLPTKNQGLYRIPQTPETELPRRVFATFADPSAEEQPNTVIAQRNAASVKTDVETNYDLTTLSMAADDIQPLVERALRRAWVGAQKPEFSYWPGSGALKIEPADVRMISADGELLRSRCTRTIIKADRSIDFEWEVDGEVQFDPPSWEVDDAASITSLHASPGATSDGRTNDTITYLVGTKGFVVDTPLLFDADDQTAPFLYDAAAPATPGSWTGASVWTADDNAADSEYAAGWDNFGSDEAATWGIVSGALPDATSDVQDNGSTLTVVLPNGETLSSVTFDQLLASQGVNLALVGSELIQFQTATLVSTNTWELTGLIRGVRGTEWAIPDHASGENFLLINAKIHKRTIGAGEIGDTDYYRFATLSIDDIDSATTIAVDFAANAHRPYSPAHLSLVRDAGTGNWTISWQRRTRIGGATLDGQDVPLGETSELYRVKIMSGATILASYDVTAQSKVYTNAEQVADWGGAQTSLSVEVVQVSPALSLEGFTASASA